eukprot:11171729-Lingulodinium_polyedra.AAC.1
MVTVVNPCAWLLRCSGCLLLLRFSRSETLAWPDTSIALPIPAYLIVHRPTAALWALVLSWSGQ